MLIDKNNLPIVDMDFMNETHYEDVDLINDLYKNIELYNQDSSLENFENLKMKYKEWIEHTVNHFATEEEEMVKRGFFAIHFIKVNMMQI